MDIMNPPASLGETGAEKWRQLQPKLHHGDQGTLDTLEVYCASYERWTLAQEWLTAHGDVLEIVSDKGVVLKAQPAPKLDVAARAERAMADAMKLLRRNLSPGAPDQSGRHLM